MSSGTAAVRIVGGHGRDIVVSKDYSKQGITFDFALSGRSTQPSLLDTEKSSDVRPKDSWGELVAVGPRRSGRSRARDRLRMRINGPQSSLFSYSIANRILFPKGFPDAVALC